MGDASYSPPELKSIQDTPNPETMEANHIGQNTMKPDEHCATSIEEQDLIKLPNSEGMEEGETHLERFKPQTESEAAQTDVSNLDEDGTIPLNSHEAREEDSNDAKYRDCGLFRTNHQEVMQESTMEETGAQALAKVSHSNKTEELLSNLESPTIIECSAVNQGRSSCFPDSSNGVRVTDTMEDGNVVSSNTFSDNIIREDGNAVHREALSDSDRKEAICLEETDGFGKEFERLNSLRTPPPYIDSDISTESRAKNNVQPPLFPTANENDEVVRVLAALPPATTTAERELHIAFQNEVDHSFDTRNQQWPDQGSGVTSLISSDLEGWQRFDAGGAITNTDHTHGTDQRLELWEQLLDDGFGSIEGDARNSPLQLALAPSFEDNKLGLASPGNPFIEGLERVSSFSEADGFARNGDLPRSGGFSQSFEEPSSLHFHGVSGNDDSSSGMASAESGKNAVQLESVNEHGSKLHLQASSKKPLPSFDSLEPFEAPSFMSLVDPKSQALFEAYMPTFQASSTECGQPNGGENWVANFDLMAPSTQEIMRSSSMPRSGTEAPGQRPGQSFSFAMNRGQEPSKISNQSPHQSKTGLLSPKLSPLVQKVVNKVRTTPVVANGVLNSVRQSMSPKASDKKSASKSMWTCCTCW